VIRSILIDGNHFPNPAQILFGAWNGRKYRPTYQPVPAPRLENPQVTFVAHSRAFPEAGVGTTRIWTSGSSSWFRLAKKGIWVEGCAEGLGFDHLQRTYGVDSLDFLGLPEFFQWTVLTHASAVPLWNKNPKVLATYKLDDYGQDLGGLKTATHLFWSSGSQFNALKELADRQAHHSCGPGRTADCLRDYGIKPFVFPSIEEWKKWLN